MALDVGAPASDKIGGDRTQMTLIYRIFADFFHGIHLGERSYNFDKKTTELGLGCAGELEHQPPALQLGGKLQQKR